MQAAARRVTTRRSLSHSRRRCTADCPPTDFGSASLSNNGEESVTTTRTPLDWALANTPHRYGTREHSHMVGTLTGDVLGAKSATQVKPAAGRRARCSVRASPPSLGLIRLRSPRCGLCCGPNPPIGAEKLSWLRRWQRHTCSTAATAATPARRPCTAKHSRLLSLAAAQGYAWQR